MGSSGQCAPAAGFRDDDAADRAAAAKAAAAKAAGWGGPNIWFIRVPEGKFLVQELTFAQVK